jgi:cytochrome b6-f complex iron-sulfur subunit
MGISRKKFIDYILGGSLLGWLGSTLYPVLAYLKPPKVPEVNVNSVNAGMLTDFSINSSKILKFGRIPVILIRKDSGEFRAFEATCTHLDCIVQYKRDEKQIYCACHNGRYDLHGLNISGPPPRPLVQFDVNIIRDEIVVSKPKPV